MTRESRDDLVVEVDDNYEILFETITERLPETHPDGSRIRWLFNLNVRLKARGRAVQGATVRLRHSPNKRYVYYKGEVIDMPANHELPVGDPAIGII